MNEYLESLYEFISSQDTDFSSGISKKDWVSSMESDTDYNSQIYTYLSDKDKMFSSNLSLEEFKDSTLLKKKEELQPTVQKEDTESIFNKDKDVSSLDAFGKPIDNKDLDILEKSMNPSSGMDYNDFKNDTNLASAYAMGKITDEDLRNSGIVEKTGPVSVFETPNVQENTESLNNVNKFVTKTKEQIDDIVSFKKLDQPYQFQDNEGSDDTFVKDNFNVADLEKRRGFNVKDFNGFLQENGYKKDFLEKKERGLFDYNGERLSTGTIVDAIGVESSPKEIQFALEMEKKRMLELYIEHQYSNDIEWQKLQDYKETGVSPDIFDKKYQVSDSNIDPREITDYMSKEMPLVTKTLKEVDEKQQKLYREHKNGGRGWNPLIDTGKEGWRGMTDRLVEMKSSTSQLVSDITGIDYFQNVSDVTRNSLSKEILERGDNLQYVYASGKEVEYNNTKYLVDERGDVYDTDDKIKATPVLSSKDYDNIIAKSEKEGTEGKTFSAAGGWYQTANIVGDMAVQIGAQGLGGKMLDGIAKINRIKNITGVLKSLPMKRSTSSAILAQATMGASSGYENTYKAAIDSGLNESEAKELAGIGSIQMAALYAITAPISPQTKATEAFFGKVKNTVIKDAIESYKKLGNEGFKSAFSKISTSAINHGGEGLKEVFQENVQQAGETFIVNKNVNKEAGEKIMKDTITLDEFINTSILSFAAGSLMPMMGSVKSGVVGGFKSSLRLDAVDRLKTLQYIVANEKKVTDILSSQVKEGIYSQEKVEELFNEIKTFKDGIGKIPKNLKAKTSLEVIDQISGITKLQNDKKTLDPAFHEEIDKEIAESREKIKEIIAKEKTTAKETVAKEAVVKKPSKEEEQEIELLKMKEKDLQSKLKEVAKEGTVPGTKNGDLFDKLNNDLSEAVAKREEIEEKYNKKEIVITPEGTVIGEDKSTSITVTEEYNDLGKEYREKKKQLTLAVRDNELTIEESKVKRIALEGNFKKAKEAFEDNSRGYTDKIKKETEFQVDNAKKSLKKLAPDVTIEVYDTYEAYAKATGETGNTTAGTYDPAKKIISINLSKVSKTTVAHEVFHALIISQVKSDKEAKRLSDAMLKAVYKSASPELRKKLDKHASQYSDAFKSEEALAELVGILASEYDLLTPVTQNVIKKWLDRLAKMFGLKQFTDNEVIDILNTISNKIATGETVESEDFDKDTEQGDSGQVGTFTFNKKRDQKAPSIDSDKRPAGKFVTQKKIEDYKGQNFVTNMYDFTNYGPTDIGGGIVLDLYGGKNYPAMMMEKLGKKMGEVSSLAAFNTVIQAEAFIKNSIDGNANLFAPHVGTKNGSWQFQQSIFEQLTDKFLDNKVITNKELIDTFNSGLGSASAKKALAIFSKKYGKNLKNLNEFTDNPKKLVELLNIDNNYSPELRKVLNDKISSNKKVQAFLGVKNKAQFAELLEDPMNVGSEAFDIIGVIEFDNTTFEKPFKPKKGDADYHPSFAWTVRAKINAIVQPVDFYQSTDVTDSYTKHNKSGPNKSTRENTPNFKSSNVASSAGSGPKVATVKEGDLNNDVSTNKGTFEGRKQKIEDEGTRQRTAELSRLLETNTKKTISKRGINKRSVQSTKRLGGFTVNVVNEYTLDNQIDTGLKNSFLGFKGVQKIYEIKDGDVYRKMMVKSLLNNKFAASVTVHSEEDFKDMRLFVTEDGSTGVTLTKEGFLGGAFSDPNFKRPKNLSQLMVVGIKEGATTAEAFDTVLPDYYSNFGFKAVSRTAFNDEYKPMIENGDAIMDWDYDTYADFNDGKPDVVFFIYDGGDRNSIEDRLGSFDKYSDTGKKNTKSFDKNGYDKAELVMKQEAVKASKFEKRSQIVEDSDIEEILEEINSGVKEEIVRERAKKKGFSKNQIDQILSKTNVTVSEIREASDADILGRIKKKGLKDFIEKTRTVLLDRQAMLKNILKGIKSSESLKALNQIVTRAGSSGYADMRFNEADKKIYGKLSQKLIKKLDELIYVKRVISINKNRRSRDIPEYKGFKGYNENNANADLKSIKESMSEEEYNDLSRRADQYFNSFEQSLLRMYESGLISEVVYNQLKETEYSPIKTIKYLMPENMTANEIEKITEITGMTSAVIKTLSNSNESTIIMDSRWLLMTNISMIESRIFENRMLNTVSEALDSATAEEQKMLEENVKENEVIGESSNGKQKFKYDVAKVPVGFKKVPFVKDGQNKYMVLSDEMARQLMDVKVKLPRYAQIAIDWSGTKILRFFATSGNPLFPIANTFIDFKNILFFSDVYGKNKYLGGTKLAFDVTKSTGKKLIYDFMNKFTESTLTSYDALYKEFMEHGGSMNYLSQDGLVAIKGFTSSSNILKGAKKAMVSIGGVISYAGEISEQSFRIAVYKKAKETLLEDFKKNNNREPNSDELNDILFEASATARETIDFSQGGTLAKGADKIFPYLNPAFQGFRRANDFAVKDPIGFASSMLQAMSMAGGLMAYSLFNLFRGMDDDDDVLEILKSIGSYENANYHVVFTGEKDEDGEFDYVRVRKLPVLSVITTIAEQLVLKTVLSNRNIGYDMDSSSAIKTLENAVPFVPTPKNLLMRNPVLAASITYISEKDYFYDSEIFNDPRNYKLEPWARGVNDDKVAQIYKDLGKALNFSPKVAQVSIEKILTSETTNPLLGVLYSGYDGIAKEGTSVGNEFTSLGSRLWGSVEKKFQRKTNKNLVKYREQESFEDTEKNIETKIYMKEQKVYKELKTLMESDGVTTDKLKEIVKSNFDKIEWKRYYKKYYTYSKSKNIDRGLLDILYENVPEVQAKRIFDRFGSDISPEEVEEIKKVYKASRKKFSKKGLYIYGKKYRVK